VPLAVQSRGPTPGVGVHLVEGIPCAGCMDSVASTSLEWLQSYTYAVVFIGILIDATGLPFPGRLLLVAAGALTRSDYGAVMIVIALAASAAMLMDFAWYVAGRAGGDRVLALYRKLPGWRRGRRGRSEDTADYFAKYGAATLFLGRFFLSLRALTWPVAATRGVGYLKFLAVDLVAAVTWSALWVWLGVSVGAGWAAAAETAGGWLLVIGTVLFTTAAVATGIYLWAGRGRDGAPASGR
jgi:membrane protein DedA with SNARE-associated domain